jgi:hypothetical protein
MKKEEVHIGSTVRVRERHRIAERRGMVGRVADHYGEMVTWPWTCASREGSGGFSGLRTWRRSHLPGHGGVCC